MIDRNLHIVVLVYNRPESLRRCLKSLSVSLGDDVQNVYLIYSFEFNYLAENERVIAEFEHQFIHSTKWYNTSKLGVDLHFLQCIERSMDFELTFFLEDDHYCSEGIKTYFNFSLDAIEQFAGLSLHSYPTHPITGLPFLPLKSSGDFYAAQRITSRGLVLTRQQATLFTTWLSTYKPSEYQQTIPSYLRQYGDTIWETLFTKYLIEQDLFILYPYQSAVTVFGDRGVHYKQTYDRFVPQVTLPAHPIRAVNLASDIFLYDAWYELKSNFFMELSRYVPLDQLEIDLNGTKENWSTEYVLTSKAVKNPIISFTMDLKPMELNVMHGLIGSDLHLAEAKNVIPENFWLNQRRLLKQRLYHQQRLSFKELCFQLIMRFRSNSIYN